MKFFHSLIILLLADVNIADMKMVPMTPKYNKCTEFFACQLTS